MKNSKTSFVCGQCGVVATKWAGQCTDCGVWNSITETVIDGGNNKFSGYAGVMHTVKKLSEISSVIEKRIDTGLDELNRVLGGGLVEGSVVLIGGDPGIGKSTLLLQSLAFISNTEKVLYITGEESLQQVSLRAQRLGLGNVPLQLLAQTQVESIVALAESSLPKVIVIDSIQTIFTELLQAAPGSVSQVRESAAQLVRFAKRLNIALFLVGHVTKDGALAGPRVLEHMVDTVLYFEGQQDSRFRLIRAVKNRFGAANELGIFAMTDKGLKGVNNPSAIFLARTSLESFGNVVMVTIEGSRPLLIEVQALVDDSHGNNPRRVSVGIDSNRIAMLLAVLSRHANITSYNMDVFLNVVGGVKIVETASDLAVVFAIVSSLKRRSLKKDLIVFGEIGLSGEIRPVQNGQERIKEAAKHGFKYAIVPSLNAPKVQYKDIEVIAVEDLNQALEHI